MESFRGALCRTLGVPLLALTSCLSERQRDSKMMFEAHPEPRKAGLKPNPQVEFRRLSMASEFRLDGGILKGRPLVPMSRQTAFPCPSDFDQAGKRSRVLVMQRIIFEHDSHMRLSARAIS